MPKKILFICTDNRCRSPMAERILKKWIQDDRWSIGCGSAGLAAFHGIPATAETIEVCRERGMDISNHQSQPLSKTLVLESDLILTMTSKHKESIVRKMPGLESKVRLLSDFAGEGMTDIEDPAGQSLEQYRKTLLQIEDYLFKAKDLFKV